MYILIGRIFKYMQTDTDLSDHGDMNSIDMQF